MGFAKYEDESELTPGEADRRAMVVGGGDGAALRQLLIASGYVTPIEAQSTKQLRSTLIVLECTGTPLAGRVRDHVAALLDGKVPS